MSRPSRDTLRLAAHAAKLMEEGMVDDWEQGIDKAIKYLRFGREVPRPTEVMVDAARLSHRQLFYQSPEVWQNTLQEKAGVVRRALAGFSPQPAGKWKEVSALADVIEFLLLDATPEALVIWLDKHRLPFKQRRVDRAYGGADYERFDTDIDGVPVRLWVASSA